MSYQTFVSLSPVIHQVCSSDLTTDSWISLLTDSYVLDQITDTWMGQSAQFFELLSSVCQLANVTATENVHGFLSRTFATSYVLVETDFYTQVNATINQLIESTVISFGLFANMTRTLMQADQPVTLLKSSQLILDYIGSASGDENVQSLRVCLDF